MNELLFEFNGDVYPTYLRDGNAMQYIEPIAKKFCKGVGLDVGAGPADRSWSLKGAHPIDRTRGDDAMNLPSGIFDFIASSHCLEHLDDPVAAIEHWKSRIRPGGVLFLYLPSYEMEYWRPWHCRKHRHVFRPADVVDMLKALGFVNILHSERDLNWSFSVVGFNGE